MFVKVIEAMAFEEEPPDFTEKDDLTMPDNDGILQEAKEELESFRVSTLILQNFFVLGGMFVASHVANCHKTKLDRVDANSLW